MLNFDTAQQNAERNEFASALYEVTFRDAGSLWDVLPASLPPRRAAVPAAAAAAAAAAADWDGQPQIE